MNFLTSFFGGPPAQVITRLTVMSLIVGAVLSFFGWHPADLITSFINFFGNFWERGWDAVKQLGQYILLGAIIVVPVWLFGRLFKDKK